MNVSRASKVLLAAVAVLLLQGGRLLAGDQDFTLHNKTGVEIHQLFVSPHSTNDWEEDVLGQDTLPDGESLKITFPARDHTDDWDVKVTDKDGNSVTWENLRLTEITDVTLTIDKDGNPVATSQNGE